MPINNIAPHNKIPWQFNIEEESATQKSMIEHGYDKNKPASLSNLPIEVQNKIFGYITYSFFYEESIKQLLPIKFINKILNNNSQYFLDNDPTMKRKITKSQIKSQLRDSMREFIDIVMEEFDPGPLKKDKIRTAVKESLLNEIQCMSFLIDPEDEEMCENILIALDEIAKKTDIKILQLQISTRHEASTYREIFINDLFEKIKLITSNNRELSRTTLICQNFDMRPCITNLGEAFAGKFIDKFSIRQNKIGEADVKKLASYLKDMTIGNLSITFNQIGNSDLEHIAKALPKNIKKLNLSFNDITQEGADKFFKILSEYTKNYPEYDLVLETINLSENYFNYPEIKNSKGKIIRVFPEKPISE